MSDSILIAMVAVALLVGGYLAFRPRRSALDVLADLQPEDAQGIEELESDELTQVSAERVKRRNKEREFREAGALTEEERASLLKRERIFPVAGVSVSILFALVIGKQDPLTLFAAIVFGAALGYLVFRRSLTNRKRTFHRQIDFYLPIVMERLVMGVQAGLDVFATIRALLELETAEDSNQKKESPSDPVTALLREVYHLTEKGIGFEDALQEVSSRVPSPALRHAFLHLGVAHKEGGELVFPLRELSDATQLYFQETIEEEIAKLPVKATMPLLVTFVGLLIVFVTAPMLQVLDFLSQAAPK